MNQFSDHELLRDYAERQSDSAFAELVRRHIDIVYSAALRMVIDPQTAEDITQNTFIALTKNARQVRNRSVLSSWLHSTARNFAANAIRTEVRRRAREQEAAVMNELLANEPEAFWKNIAPHLDDAIAELSDSDRDALLLRYFERKSVREIAHILNTSEPAAQKRVSRAVERLREFFSKRGVAVGAGGLVVLISANAVHAAPLTLVPTISTAAVLATTTIHTSTAIAATKAIAMTLFQKTLITATVAIVAGAGIYQAHQATQLRAEIQTLQQQQAPLAAQIQQLQQERDEATNQVASLSEEVAKANGNTTELMMLRRENSALRQRVAQNPRATPSTLNQASVADSQTPDESSQIAMAIAQGDPTALQRLTDYSKSQHQFYNTNKVDLTNEQLSALSTKAFSGLWSSFDYLTAEAIKGNSNARQAIDQALRSGYLEGTAVNALGKLAANGDDAALQTLLNYDKNGILLSGAVGALALPAGNGNEPAIAVLAAVLKDNSKKPLWNLASTGLQKAAANGNAVAIDALKSMPQSQ